MSDKFLWDAAMLFLRIWLAAAISFPFVSFAASVQKTDRPLADTVGYTGLAIAALIVAGPWIWAGTVKVARAMKEGL